jgi:hypothetical protein
MVGETTDNFLTGGCAGFAPGHGAIYVHRDNVAAWAGQDKDLAALILSHEIGHSLGLGEAGLGYWTVMNNPPPVGDCRQMAQWQKDVGAPTGPTFSDTLAASPCVRDGRQVAEYPGSEYWEFTGMCWERWEVYTIWNCTDTACWPTTDSWWVYQGVYCGSPSDTSWTNSEAYGGMPSEYWWGYQGCGSPSLNQR